MCPEPCGAHQRQGRVCAVEDTEDVGVDHPPPLLGVGVLDRSEQHHAGVVDEHVQAARARRACAATKAAPGPPRQRRWARRSRVRLGSTICWTSASMRSARRAPSATAAPACAQASAVASPMPEEAPVTATTWPERSIVHSPSLALLDLSDMRRRLSIGLERLGSLFWPVLRVLAPDWAGIPNLHPKAGEGPSGVERAHRNAPNTR